MIVWGWSTKLIGQVMSGIQCSHCKYIGLTIAVFQIFFNLFFIPTIPLKKYYSFFCSNCGTEFQPNSSNIDLNSKNDFKVKTPWWGYSGLFVISFFIVTLFCFEKYEQKQTLAYLESPRANDIIVIQDKENKEFPYIFIKIKNIDKEGITFSVSKYSYSKLDQAKRAAIKAAAENDFMDKDFEGSIENLKKMDVQSITRFS